MALRDELEKMKSREEAVSFLIQTGRAKNKHDAERLIYKTLPLEKHYQRKIMEYLRRAYPDAFVWKAAAGAYSQAGIPDVCAVIAGRYFGFEIKRPLIGEPTAIQLQTMKWINQAGGCAGVVSFPREAQEMITMAFGFYMTEEGAR